MFGLHKERAGNMCLVYYSSLGIYLFNSVKILSLFHLPTTITPTFDRHHFKAVSRPGRTCRVTLALIECFTRYP